MIDKDSTLMRTEKKILMGGKQEILYHVKLTYPKVIKKMKQKEDKEFKKFMEMFTKFQVNIPFIRSSIVHITGPNHYHYR